MVEATIVTPEFLQREDVYNECIGGVSPGGSNKIPLLQYDLQGNFKREWESGVSVTRYFTGNNLSRAIYQAVDREDKQCYGSLWRRKQSNDYPLKISSLKHNYKKPVGRYTLDGILLDIWDSADQAATKCLKKDNGRQIKKACDHEAIAYGYQWRYIDSEKPTIRIKEYEDPRTVYQLNDNFEIVKIWESSAKIHKEGYLNIVAVLKEKEGRIRCKGSRFVHAMNYKRYCKKYRAMKKNKN